jgi:excisionase family DNA binding protein
MATKLISLAELSDLTGLPMAWLRREADEGRLPYLRVGRRRMFDPEAVRAALTKAQGVSRGE